MMPKPAQRRPDERWTRQWSFNRLVEVADADPDASRRRPSNAANGHVNWYAALLRIGAYTPAAGSVAGRLARSRSVQYGEETALLQAHTTDGSNYYRESY